MYNAPVKTGALTISVAAAVVLVAAFMPWGQIKGNLTVGGMELPTSAGLPFLQTNMTLTGWNGNLTLMGMKIPNWTTVLIAGILAVWAWADPSIGRKGGAYVLALCGLAFGVGSALILNFAKGGQLGIGVLVVMCCFVVILATLLGSRKLDPPKPSPAVQGAVDGP